MGYVGESMDGLCVSIDDLCGTAETGGSKGRMGRRRNYDDGTKEFKSKNLDTERKRRAKLSSRLLMLRSLVPIITNMNKATIIDDAITYIQKLQENVQNLTQELQEMEANSEELAEPETGEIDAAEEMRKFGVKEEVKVTQIDGNKHWVKIIIEKKRGRFKKLLEAMNTFGIELIDTNVTTTKGAFLITTSIQGMQGERLAVQQTKELLVDIISAI